MTLPEPMLTNYPCRHMTLLGPNQLTVTRGSPGDALNLRDISKFKIQRFKPHYSSKLHNFNMNWHSGIGIKIVEFHPCLLFITLGMEILIKAWSRCRKDHHKYIPLQRWSPAAMLPRSLCCISVAGVSCHKTYLAHEQFSAIRAQWSKLRLIDWFSELLQC